MSFDCNTFSFSGRIATDPENIFFANGTCVCKFRVAIDTSYNKEKKSTLWLDCEAFGPYAEKYISLYAFKGCPITCVGELCQDEWEDKNGGGKRTKIKCRINKVTLHGKRSEQTVAERNENRTHTPVAAENDDEPPF